MFGFSWWVIAAAVAIVAFVSFVYDIDWWKVALVVIAILFVSGLYREGKLPEKLEPIAEKVFFWVDKESNEAEETKETSITNETEKTTKKVINFIVSLLTKRIFGVRLWTILLIIDIARWLHTALGVDLGKAVLIGTVFLFGAFLYSNDKLPEVVEPLAGRIYRNENNIDREDIYRPLYNKGTCYELSGTPCVLCIYLGDAESSWTPEEVKKFDEDVIIPGIQYLNEQAALWDVDLDMGLIRYAKEGSGGSDVFVVRYPGVIPTVLDGEQTDREEILKLTAKQMGFSSTKKFYNFAQKISGTDQVVIMLLVNKDGRSHAGPDIKDDDGNDIESYVVYSSLNGHRTRYGTLAHELLHAFGADDLYEETSTGERADRAAIAKQYYPNDIMLSDWNDNAVVGAYTAYAVGWTDVCPEECMAPEFWEGDWSRE